MANNSFQVTRDFVMGPLRKLVQDEQILKRELFPLRYCRYHRASGLLEIGSANSTEGPYKHRIEGSEIVSANFCETI